MPHKDLEERRAYKRAWYRHNAAKVYEEVQARRRKLANQLQEYKKTLSCKICSEDESCCLDFHHLKKDKTIAVSMMPWQGSSWKKIMLEIKKCIVVCRNCHAKIHAGKVLLAARDASNVEERVRFLLPTPQSND